MVLKIFPYAFLWGLGTALGELPPYAASYHASKVYQIILFNNRRRKEEGGRRKKGGGRREEGGGRREEDVCIFVNII